MSGRADDGGGDGFTGDGLKVECYAGHRGEETPRRFLLGDRAIEVVTVLDSWLAPDHRYFKVLGSDQATYILRHDPFAGRWELRLFKRAGQPQ